MNQPQCNLCSGSSWTLHQDQGWRKLIRCRACGLVVADPLPSEEEKADTELQAYEGEVLPETADFFRDCGRNFKEDAVIRGFREALDWIGEQREHGAKGELLDVGPGTGVFMHLAEAAGWSVRGIDLCDVSAQKASDEFDVQVDVGDFTKFDYVADSWSCISMLDVLEHTIDPTAFLRRAYELLEPGGLLYVAVPNGHCLLTVILDHWARWGLPGSRWILDRLYVSPHVYYFYPRLLRVALQGVGFEVVGVKGGNVYLGRYRMPLAQRIPLELVLRTGSVLGMSARILALARKPASP